MRDLLNFKMSDKLVLGLGAVAELSNLLKDMEAKRVLLVTDQGLVKAGISDSVSKILDGIGLGYAVFDKVEPDPRIEIVYQCLDEAKKLNADLIIGLGGGSSLDIAKIAAILMTNDEDIASIIGIDNIKKPGLPTIMIPTTAGTGSEVTPIAVLSDKQAHLKKGVVSDYLYPSIALVDPELTSSLPPGPTAYTGVDALTHLIEAYTNKHSKPFVDMLALEGIRLIGQNLRIAVSDGKNLEARYNMAMASLCGGLCLGPVNTAAVHALAYPLGGSYDIPHGIANSLLLPYVMEFNLPVCNDKFVNIARALGEDLEGNSNEQASQLAVQLVAKLCRDVGIVGSIKELDIAESAIESMAESAMQVTRLLNNNPRELTLADARDIYLKAYNGLL